MLLLAHRGASADAPENTLAAFAEAVKQGADGVELDAMVCGSGEVVVCHDEKLGRLAGVDVQIATTPLWKLRALDMGSRLGFSPAAIPTLADVIDALPESMVLNIELKCETVDDRGLSAKVVELVRVRNLARRVILSSFNPLCLVRVAELAPRFRRGFLIDPDKSFAMQDSVYTALSANYSVHPHFSQVTPGRVASWRARKRKLAVWTVDDPLEARRLEQLGVEYCITNRPRALRAALERSA